MLDILDLYMLSGVLPPFDPKLFKPRDLATGSLNAGSERAVLGGFSPT
jgi:hypothetical protein